MMDGFNDGMGGGWWIVMTLFWLFLIAAIVWAGARLFPGRPEPRESAGETPEEELDRRLVRGELDVETYEALREKLRASRAERGWAR